jgi:hypothetical protein
MNATGEFYTLQPQDAPHEMEELGGLLAANNLRLDSRGIRGLRHQERVVACAGLDRLRLGSEVVFHRNAEWKDLGRRHGPGRLRHQRAKDDGPLFRRNDESHRRTVYSAPF